MSCIALGLVEVPAHNLRLGGFRRSSVRIAVGRQVVIALFDERSLAHPCCCIKRPVFQDNPASLHEHFVTLLLDHVLIGCDVAVVALVNDLLGALLLFPLLHPLLLLLHHHAD